MSSEWPLEELEVIADEVTVGYVGTMASEYVESGVPFLRSLNIEQFRVNQNDIKFISPDFHQRIKKSALKPGDVAIVRTGKPGTCAVVPDWLIDANCSDLVVVRCGKRIRPRFLCYWVNSVATHHIDSHTVGAVQQHFNVGAAKKMKVAVPSLPVQDEVIAVLGSLDDRITLLCETNAT
jgi:type I restriction enzyme S subunit